MRIVENPNKKPKQLELAENKELVNESGNKSKQFSDDEILTLLNLLALNGGRCKRTSEQAREELGLEVHPETLDRWKKRYYPSKYLEIQRNLSDTLSTKLATKITDVAQNSITLTERLQEDMEDQLDKETLSLKELPSAIRNMAQASEISVRQRQILEDKPTEILEVRNIEETLSDLVESEIIEDAQVVEDDDTDDPSSSIALPI